jgi:ATP phosphoribosyltransferase regulatory subunit
MQVGLECIGDTDILDTYESVELAAKSLALVSDSFVLDISHLGILSRLLEGAGVGSDFIKRATILLAEKNGHELSKLCEEFGVAEAFKEAISSLVGIYGEPKSTLERVKPICELASAMEQFEELETLCGLLSSSEFYNRIRLDFSVVNNMNYYNGIVFKGFLEGIPDGVLAGGEYGMLMNKMGKPAGAVGFAIYLDMLEELSSPSREYDVDVLLILGENASPETVIAAKKKLIDEGKSVSVQKAVPAKLRYKEIINEV